MYEQVSKAQWPSDTLTDYVKLKEALKLKFGPSENPLIYRSQFVVAERAWRVGSQFSAQTA